MTGVSSSLKVLNANIRPPPTTVARANVRTLDIEHILSLFVIFIEWKKSWKNELITNVDSGTHHKSPLVERQTSHTYFLLQFK